MKSTILWRCVALIAGLSLLPGNAQPGPPDELQAFRRSSDELQAGLNLLEVKLAFLLWAGQTLDAQKPVLEDFRQSVSALSRLIESRGYDKATEYSNRATDLMWRLFRETKPMLDARPGDRSDPRKRYEMVAPIVEGSITLARIKHGNTLATGQDPRHFQSAIDRAAELVARAREEAAAGNYRSAMQALSQAVPPVDEAIVGLPRNSAGIRSFSFAPRR